MSKQQHTTKKYAVWAYCSDCHRLLQKSTDFTEKELREKWDQTVTSACAILCPNCHSKFPNFHIDLRIHDNWKNKNYTPKQFFPNPKNPFDLQLELAKFKQQVAAQKAQQVAQTDDNPHYSESNVESVESEEVSHD